jgi:hypothetical protein
MKHRILACLIALVTTGCATTPRIPASLQYSPPPAGSGTASIRGSEKPSTFFDNFTVYVVSIDGKRVMAGRKGWKVPLIITTGHHTLTAEFNRGDYRARTDIDFNAAAGVDYEVGFDSDVKIYGSNSYVDFWVANTATNKPVTGVKRGSVTLSNAGTTFIPIFVPGR